MAIMKLTAFNAGLKGKIAGTVFLISPFGQVCMTKAGLIDAIASGSKLTKADAGRVINPKKNITKLATDWRTLSTAQRSSWGTGAPNFPAKNRFGDTYTPSGFQVYMTLNMALLNAGLATLTVCPVPATVGNAPSFTVDYNSSSKALEVDNLTLSADYTYTLYGTRSISVGKKSTMSMYKALYIFQTGDTFPFNLGNYWTDQFGPVPTHANLWFMLTSVNNITGQVGQPYIFQLTY